MNKNSGQMPLLQTTRFVSFDGLVTAATRHQRPDRYRHLDIDLGGAPRVARGGGYSYAAASFGSDVVVQEMVSFNRLLDYDGGVRVRAEAGTTLLQLMEFGRSRGLQVPVLPGYPLITLGGCIAADVHGKNPARDGTFCDWVEALTLYHPTRGFMTIDRASEPALFAATCGGFGMTGLIVDATLTMTALPGGHVQVEASAVTSFADALRRVDESSDHDFAYTWHDGCARERHFGRGVVFRGRWTDEPSTPVLPFKAMTAASRGRSPVALWNRWTVPAANAAFAIGSTWGAPKRRSAFDAAFPFARQTVYHRFFGRRGLAEVQVLVGRAELAGFLERLRELVQRTNALVTMISTKPFRGRQVSLSLSGSGVLIAIDLVRTPACHPFLEAFDALVIDTGAQPNVAKDSRLPQAVATRALPNYRAFRERICEFDPDRLYQSELSRRLAL